MKVLKFGGSSMLDGFENVKKISVNAAERDGSTVVVVSAFKGITNALIALGEAAEHGHRETVHQQFQTLKAFHLGSVKRFIQNEHHQSTTRAQVEAHLKELSVKLDSCLELGVLPPQIKDLIASFGERLSALILASSLESDGIDVELIDARELVKTDAKYTEAKVNFEHTNKLIQQRLGSSRKKISVVTGFIGSAPDGTTTTLGRGGSDSTAAIFAAALDAEEIQLWKEVDGVLSADPKLVHGAETAPHLSYDEMRALAVAGAKVVHPPAVLPAENKKTPITVRNTFKPDYPHVTRIDSEKNGQGREVKVVSSINNVTIITLTGTAIHEGAGVDHRVTTSTKLAGANVLMKSQANEDSICFVVTNQDAQRAIEELRKIFSEELKDSAVSIKSEPNHAILAVVGEGMKDRAGVAGRLFTTMAKSGVSAHAFAQDAKELCIAVAIPQADLKNALQAVHDEFVLQQKIISLFIIGPGRVGKEMVKRLAALKEDHLRQHGIEFRIAGVMNSSRMLMSTNGGIPFETWEQQLSQGEVADLQEFVQRILRRNDVHSVVVDASASKEPVEYYEGLLKESIAIVTPNKNGMASDANKVRAIRQAARRGNTVIGYETNVGAGMGAISKIRDAVEGGDEVLSIEGSLSGTLGFVFSSYDGTKKFSEVVHIAYKKDLTEPNPAEDFSLGDVRRKLLILAREAGAQLEESDIAIIPFISEACSHSKDANEFFKELEKMDDHFAQLHREAESEGKRLRVIAKFENGKASIGLEKVGPEHPAYSLQGTKNLVSCTTRDRHDGWSVSGAGAGIGITASGVIADLVKAAKRT